MQRNRIVDYRITETLPVIEPIDLATAKKQLIIDFTDDDAKITTLITQCRKAIENYCSVSLIPKTVLLTADLYKETELPFGPVVGIQSVQQRIGTQGSGPATYQTASTGWAQDGSEFLQFRPSNDLIWDWGYPIPHNIACNYRWQIGYTVGYNPVPEDLILAILNEIAYRYENRGDEQNIRASAFTQQGVCEPARILADPYVRLIWKI